MFQEIHNNDTNYSKFFVQQFEDKLTLMGKFRENNNYNLIKITSMKNFQNYNKNDYLEKQLNVFKYFTFDIYKHEDLNEKKSDFKMPENIIEYFKDFGIKFFYEINCSEGYCPIF